MSEQETFRTALLDAAQPVPGGLVDGQGIAAGRRFSVYRNNIAVSLTEALETGFPVIFKLLGEENFRAIAGIFLRAHPPASPLMMHYGQEFPDFLDRFEPLKHLAYLSDVARLELALRASYHAADADPIDATELQNLAPDALLRATFTFAPAMRLIRSRWPVCSIWMFNMKEGAQAPANTGENVLILRAEFDPEPHLLPPGGGLFLHHMLNGESFSTAHEAAIAAVPEFDLGAVLGLLLQGGAITKISTDTPTDIST